MVVSTTSEVAASVEAAAWKRLHVVPMLRMVHVDEGWSTSVSDWFPCCVNAKTSSSTHGRPERGTDA